LNHTVGVKENNLLPVPLLDSEDFSFQVTPRTSQQYSEEQPGRYLEEDMLFPHQPLEEPIVFKHCPKLWLI
jgi:hypothetical protein